MQTLYSIADQYLQILWEIEEGELPEEELMEKLEEVKGEADVKIDNIATLIKTMNGEIDAIEVEQKKLADRAKAKKNTVARIEQYLSNYMPKLGYDKFENAKHKISFRTSTVVEIADEFIEWAKANNADDLLRYKDPEPNKTAIKKAIQDGEYFDYAKLTTKKNIQVK